MFSIWLFLSLGHDREITFAQYRHFCFLGALFLKSCLHRNYSQLFSFLFLIQNVTFLVERLSMIVWRSVLMYIGEKEALEEERGKKRVFGEHRR